MYQIIKRDGKIVDFDITKIASAIKKAFEATDTEYTDDIIDFIALKVSADFLPKIKDGYVAVEDIQDSVEAVLSRGGYEGVAKAYILYRKQREKLRNMKNTYLDYKETVNSYVNALDWRVKENSTVTYSVGGLILSNSGAITANYWLSEIYDEEIGNAHRNCDLHLHDLSMLLLRRLEPQATYTAGSRYPGQDQFLPGKPPEHPLQSDGKLPRHNAERMGGRSGLLELRYLSCSLC